jgi:hypothetical protein
VGSTSIQFRQSELRSAMQPVTSRPVSPPLRWRCDLEHGWQSLRRLRGLRLLLSSEPLLQLVIHLGRLVRGRARDRVWARVRAWVNLRLKVRLKSGGLSLGPDLDFRLGFASNSTFASSMFIGAFIPGRPGLGGRGGADDPTGRGGRGGADGPPGRPGGFAGCGGAPPGATWLGLGLWL